MLKQKVLIVDDDENIAELISLYLEKEQYDTETAGSGEEALKIVEVYNPDLILLDYAMPEMDGPAVLAAIRSNAETKDIPVVYRTGMDDTDCENGADVKPDGVVSKSEGRPSLMKAVEEILG